MPLRLATLSGLVLRGVICAVIAGGVAAAQTIDFTLVESYQGSSATIANGTTLPFLATVGTQQTVTVTATYHGTTTATITGTPPLQQLGSNEFTITSNPALTTGEIFTPNQSFTLTITFAPTSPAQANGEFAVNYTEPGPNGTTVTSTIQLGLQGQSPSFVLSYILEADQNVIQIPPGGTIPFGATQINTTASALLNITNEGSGAGEITGITLPGAGSPFKVSGKPLLPATLASGATEQLTVQYTPIAVETDNAQVVITYQGGATATVNLTGNGITSAFTYKYVVQGKATTVAPGGTITFPGANVGSTSGLIVQVTDTGSASGVINSVSTSPEFTLTNPITLPATLTAGGSFSVPLTFTPTAVGTQTGQLAIGNAFFILSGQGLGPDLTYAYTSSAGNIAVNPATGGQVVFSPVPVGQSERVTFTITNSAPSGSPPATISLIEPSVANGPFTVSSIPLPTNLAPGKSLSFTITFTPTVTGVSSGNLIVATASNTTQITLIGSGTAPPGLPSYTISGPSGTAQADTQSNISLTLSKGYPLALEGTLTITTDGLYGTDPAVAFDTGGRVVDFTIPANSTSADFAGQGSLILMQTGTVAETVTLAPTFTTTGGLNITPSSPATLQFTVPSGAPVLSTAAIADETTNSFSLVLTGYSTTRSLNSLNVTFTAATGFSIQTSIPAIDLSQVSTAWFSSAASQPYGGLFAITMPFTLQGTAKTGQTLIDAIGSVAATVSSSSGTSNSVSAQVSGNVP
jgi:hypothetical protein